VDGLLFGETQSRLIITCSAVQAGKVLAQAKILGVPAVSIGTVGGERLDIKTSAGEWSWPVAEIYDAWWNSLARLLKG